MYQPDCDPSTSSNVNSYASATTDPDSQYSREIEALAQSGRARHAMDKAQPRARHKQLMEWYIQERERSSINRYQMAVDEDFYDGLQWSDDDSQELMQRGQAPLVYNRIKPTLDWVRGVERRMRADFKVLPRRPDKVEMGNVKTQVLKYLSDVNHTAFHRSRAFFDACKAGVGWLEDGARASPDGPPIFSRYESWRNVYFDSSAMERDLSDARYLFRHKWVDLDVAIAMFPDRASVIKSSATATDIYGNDLDEEFYLGTQIQMRDNQGGVVGRRTYIAQSNYVNNRRHRVKLIEGWYRVPRLQKMCRCYDPEHELHNQPYDPKNEDHLAAEEAGEISVYDNVGMQVRVAVFTEHAMLKDQESPYKHARFGLTPVWGYRRSRDNAPYGITRNVRDPQEDLNKRMSKALHALATNRVILSEDAVDDLEMLREEVARPDSIIVKKKGSELSIESGAEMAQAHVAMAERDSAQIQDAGGVTDENLGRETNARSGSAIQARQDQGTLVMSELFDNLRFAIQIQGENQLSLAEQYMTEPQVIRVTGYKGKLDWVPINTPEVDAEGNVRFMNDMAQEQCDFVVDEMDYRQSWRMAMSEAMMEMIGKMPPEMAMQMADLVFEFVDIPGKDEVVNRIRKINGQGDPANPDDPEQKARQQATEQLKAAQAQLAMRGAEAKVHADEAKALEAAARAKKVEAEAVERTVAAQFGAMQGGQVVATMPGVAPIADEILRSSGFKDQGGEDPNIQAPATPMAAPAGQQEAVLGTHRLPLQQGAGPAPGAQAQAMNGIPPAQIPHSTNPTVPAKPALPATPGAGLHRGIETPRSDSTGPVQSPLPGMGPDPHAMHAMMMQIQALQQQLQEMRQAPKAKGKPKRRTFKITGPSGGVYHGETLDHED